MDTNKVVPHISRRMRKIVLIVIITFIVMITSFLYHSFVQKQMYTAEEIILVKYNTEAVNDVSKIAMMNMYPRMVDTYCEFAKTNVVAKDVIDKLNLKVSVFSFAEMIEVESKGTSNLISIKCKDRNSTTATMIANEIGNSIKSISSEIDKSTQVNVIQNSQIVGELSTNNTKKNVVISFVLGIFLSLAVITLMEYIKGNKE